MDIEWKECQFVLIPWLLQLSWSLCTCFFLFFRLSALSHLFALLLSKHLPFWVLYIILDFYSPALNPWEFIWSIHLYLFVNPLNGRQSVGHCRTYEKNKCLLLYHWHIFVNGHKAESKGGNISIQKTNTFK